MATVDITPTKQFFVSMLIRDIELTDAILDLLDNCVDGVIRSNGSKQVDPNRPYKGYWAKVNFSGSSFTIEDNCGGIPKSLSPYAFRIGKLYGAQSERLPTVGMYGIGMKRALFKMGRNAIVTTKHKRDAYKVAITPDWLDSDDQWTLPLTLEKSPLRESGTRIHITKLHKAISDTFQDEVFNDEFRETVATHYAVIIEKGFTIIVNSQRIRPKPTTLRYDTSYRRKGQGIAPYVYEGERNGVEFRLAVGIFDKIPTDDDSPEESSDQRRSRQDAGWTVVCNDRVVLYKDKTRWTVWGVGNVPNFHPQFISISGVIEFRSNDPSKLPMNTTKRGVDHNSQLYLEVKDFMCEGTKLFTSYTNRWKNLPKREKKIVQSTEVIEVRSLFKRIPKQLFHKVRRSGDLKFMPELPMPPDKRGGRTHKWIRFRRRIKEIEVVSNFLFDRDDVDQSRVGEECFALILREAQK